MIKGAVPLATAPFRLFVSMMFVWHGNISKSPEKASKINGFTMEEGAYYTTTTPFLKEP